MALGSRVREAAPADAATPAGAWPTKRGVFHELRASIDGHAVLSDNEICDQLWLARLAGADPGVRLGSIVELYREMAGGDERLLERAFAHARTVAPKQHRAAPDVRWHLAVYQDLMAGAAAKGTS